MVEVNRALDPDAIAVTELITAEFYLPSYFDIDHTRKESERRRNLSICGGVLGWGVPAALGAKIAKPTNRSSLSSVTEAFSSESRRSGPPRATRYRSGSSCGTTESIRRTGATCTPMESAPRRRESTSAALSAHPRSTTSPSPKGTASRESASRIWRSSRRPSRVVSVLPGGGHGGARASSGPPRELFQASYIGLTGRNYDVFPPATGSP